MKQYLDLMRRIRDTGIRQSNRTGVDTLFIPGAMMQFDLREGFPVPTTKKLYIAQTVGELCAFASGKTNAADFRAKGCTFWDKNANEDGVDQKGNVVKNAWLTNPNRKGTDDLGRVYGAQWRGWRGRAHLGRSDVIDIHANNCIDFFADADNSGVAAYVDVVDQVQNVLTTLIQNPTDRRMIISAWRPDELNQMALPPCHVLHQFIADVKNRELHLCMYQRSNDFFLGVPHNIASYSMWLTVVAALTGFKPATFTHFMADVHLYVNHLDQVEEQLSREVRALPKMIYTGPGSDEWDSQNVVPRYVLNNLVPCASVLDQLEPKHFKLEGYDPHPAIDASMAV